MGAVETRLARPERAVLEFVKSVRSAERTWRPLMVRDEYLGLAQAWQARHRRAPETLEDVSDVLRPSIAWKYDRALYRFSQEQMYGRIRDALLPYRAELEAQLDRPIANPRGSLRLNPELTIPDYYAHTDYHAQPGGMHRERLIGYITHLSNIVYWGGQNDGLALFRKAVAACPPGPFGRVLDLGCGSKSVFAMKERYPEAEVHGIDLSAPFLQYAHQEAESQGIALHLSQQNAEATNFATGSFDLVFSVLLFHEIPLEAARNVVRESHRILRPGGWFIIADGTPNRCLDAFARYVADWPCANIVEPYLREAQTRDYRALLREAGFQRVSDTSDDGPVTSYVFPFITRGVK